MAKDNSKTLKDEIRPLKDILEIIKDKVGKTETFQNVTMQQIRDMKDQQSVINGKLDEIQETQDAHTGALITIEKELKGYADMYKINDFNIRRMEKRLETLEEDSGVDVPPEFRLQPLSGAA
ncbi:hypothetical protein HYU96_02170 [Candidatus Daviesbacteria bacterium]|nr:hypothetical protein [Candidatus Daviesbacteria bacterium]